MIFYLKHKEIPRNGSGNLGVCRSLPPMERSEGLREKRSGPGILRIAGFKVESDGKLKFQTKMPIYVK
jgi:hypothetical protein